MFRLSYFIRRRPDISLADFHRYWLECHGPLVVRHAPVLGIRRHIQTHVSHDDPLGAFLRETYGTSEELFDGAADFWFKDRNELAAALASPAGRDAARDLLAAEREFIDLARSALWFGVELPQLESASGTVAHERSAIVKWLAPLWRRPELGPDETRAHWLLNHGPLVREGARAVPMLRYLQIHRFEDPLADGLRAERGSMTDPVYGHAELWFDRHAVAAAAGPEFERAIALFVEDCRLFIDLPRSPFMVGKEHVLLDLPQVTRPIPEPPSRGLW